MAGNAGVDGQGGGGGGGVTAGGNGGKGVVIVRYIGTVPYSPPMPTVWDAAAKGAGIALSGGDLIATSSSAAWETVRGTKSRTAGDGKRYFELTFAGGTYYGGGIGLATDSVEDYIGGDGGGYGLLFHGYQYHAGGYTFVGGAGALTMGVCFDADAGTLEWLDNTGAPVGSFTGIAGAFFPAGTVYLSNVTLNCGATPFTHTPPAGYVAWDA